MPFSTRTSRPGSPTRSTRPSSGPARRNGRGVKAGRDPSDFIRKRLSIVARRKRGAGPLLITKGALENVLAECVDIRKGDGAVPLGPEKREAIRARFAAWSEQGSGCWASPSSPAPEQAAYTRDDEHWLTFAGFLTFFDPPKAGVQQTIEALAARGVQLKIITGDNRRVAEHVSRMVGLDVEGVITGAELDALADEALWHRPSKRPCSPR